MELIIYISKIYVSICWLNYEWNVALVGPRLDTMTSGTSSRLKKKTPLFCCCINLALIRINSQLKGGQILHQSATGQMWRWSDGWRVNIFKVFHSYGRKPASEPNCHMALYMWWAAWAMIRRQICWPSFSHLTMFEMKLILALPLICIFLHNLTNCCVDFEI